jgi:hypothetical protein
MEFPKYLDNIGKILTLKITENTTVLPFLTFILTFGIVMFFFSVKEAAAFALIVFGIASITDYSYWNAKAHFLHSNQSLKKISTNDAETFLNLSERLFGWEELKFEKKDITVGGLIFRHITTESFPSAIAGPLCPSCDSNISCEWVFYGPGINRFRYKCLCGFEKTLKKNPKTLYLEVKTHCNLMG